MPLVWAKLIVLASGMADHASDITVFSQTMPVTSLSSVRPHQWHHCLQSDHTSDITVFSQTTPVTSLSSVRPHQWHHCLQSDHTSDITVFSQTTTVTSLSSVRPLQRHHCLESKTTPLTSLSWVRDHSSDHWHHCLGSENASVISLTWVGECRHDINVLSQKKLQCFGLSWIREGSSGITGVRRKLQWHHSLQLNNTDITLLSQEETPIASLFGIRYSSSDVAVESRGNASGFTLFDP